jgi:amino acid adenylation domain-containing protein
MSTYSNLVELLHSRALHQPKRRAYTFLADGEEKEVCLTYAELDRQARAIGALLQQNGARGERVLLLYPPGLEYIAAFFGCLYAGAVAVPTYPPRLNRSLLRLQAIVADAHATVALTTTALLSKIEPLLIQTPDLKNLSWFATDNLGADLVDEWRDSNISGETLAFLQYTSGSTALPKGVMVTHNNLLHNERIIQQACQHTELSTFAGWLPLYHDMGLIGNVLQPLFIGAPCILMSPTSFLQSPIRWLQAISRYRAATSGGPNFAYDLCVRRTTPEQRADLDLSSWSTAFNGAEPIRHETIDRFAATFQPYGFRREAFYPCYGLAEATLFVTGVSKAKEPATLTVQRPALERHHVAVANGEDDDAQTLVSCGRTFLGQSIAIVDPDSLTRRPPGQVGEIWISGESVAQGYWNRPEETETVFRARLVDTGEGPFLRTGDLGFLNDDDLFITGRLKDLIIIRGRNHYPQDIEWTVEKSHPEARPGCGAAFAVEACGEEQLVIVQETQSRRPVSPESIIDSIRREVAEDHELQVHAVVLAKPGGVSKTSSGKVQRHACRNEFLSGSLDIVAEWRGATTTDSEALASTTPFSFQSVEEAEAWLRSQLAVKLKMDPREIDANHPISCYGVDSLTAIELAHAVEVGLGVIAPMTSFLQSLTIAQLASQALGSLNISIPSPALAPAEEAATEHPLSRGQQALFFLHELNPESSAYNIARAVRLRPDINIEHLRDAFQALVDRHSALRATFTTRHGKPAQRIHGRSEVSFNETDVSGWTQTGLRERLIEEARIPFDLGQGPLLRLKLFSEPQSGGRILLLVAHHIICDFWSLAILIQELETLYSARQADATAALPHLTLQYADYIRWQEETLASPEGERLWSYWRERLSGELPILNLPTDRPRPRAQTGRGASESLKLDAQLTSALKALSQTNGVTLFMTLLAAYQALLHRYTNQTDILVGSPATGRTRAQLANLIGYFVNPLPLRADLSGDPTFMDFLSQVRQTVLGAFDHQDYPLALLVERLQPERDPARASLFQAMFVMQKAPLFGDEGLASFALGADGARLAGELGFESIALEQGAAQFDLTLTMAEAPDGLSALLQYNADLFEAATIRRMLGHFETLLAGVVENPRWRVSEAPLLTAAERQKLSSGGGDEELHSTNNPLHELFEAQVERTPEAVALISEGERLTYRELNNRANRLARYLKGMGVGPETPVGVLMERSTEMVVALIAILKVGGAYVPLDPATPNERLAFILEDARAPILLTQGSSAAALPAHNARVARIDVERETIFRQSGENLVSGVTVENAAYVIYTSGSTGLPKGVSVTHANVGRLFDASRAWFHFDERDVWTLFHSYAFDFSVWEMWGALLHGGRLVIVPYLVSRSPESFYKLLLDERVTVLNQTPSAFRQLMRYERSAGDAQELSLRLVIFGGEALDLKSLRPWFERRGDGSPQLVNMYGITETTVHVTYRPITKADAAGATGSLIGGPIPDLQVYALDRRLQPAPLGIAGEMYVGGAGLARGYLNRPDLTAERFRPNPFSQRPGARLYRTGDMARRLENDDIKYLGRIDNQVKIRGFRIELGEIEATLSSHPATRDAVVIAQDDPSGDKRLAAYVVFNTGHAPSVSELREFLKQKLPEHMIPASFVTLDRLPLTANGKLDRRALPTPGRSRGEIAEEFAPPRNDVEEVLAGIWSEALGVEQVGVHDNFFDLGGDSIRSITVVSRARERGFELSLQQLFERPTVAELAEGVAAKARALPTSQQQPFAFISHEDRERLPDDAEDAYPQTRLQLGLIFHSEHSPDYETYVTSFHLRAPFQVEALRQAVERLVSRHAMLRTSFHLTGFTEPLQVVHRAVAVSLETQDLRHLSPDEQEAFLARWLEEQRCGKFDWARLPLVRFAVHRRGEGAFQFTLIEPFLDGWSAASLITELFTLYLSLLDGRGSSVEPPPVATFRDYVALEREAIQSEECQTYWKRKLRDCAPGRLPRWAMAPSRRDEARIRRLHVQIPAEVSDKLRSLARSLAVPLKSVLLAAHLKVMSYLNGRPDVLTGLLYTGRPETVDGEHVIGLFLNAAPLRMDLPGGTWEELAQKAFAAERELLPFRRYPLADLQRSYGRQPLFDTVFNFTHFHVYQGLQELGGIEVLDAYASEQTYFDLTVQFNLDHASPSARVRLAFDYRAIEFSDEQIQAIGDYYVKALTAISDDPSERYDSLSLLSDEERRALIKWNDTAAAYHEGLRLHQLIEAQVERTPDAVAIVFEDEQLTYAELNRQANRVARYLNGIGAGPETRVGICLERSTQMVVGLLGVLKAGGAYVPLDPSYPLERLEFMLKDARASILLTQETLATTLLSRHARVVCLDRDLESINRESAENPAGGVTADNLAYVIYTSGSTGQPKGAMNTHRGICNRLLWMQDAYNLTEADRVLQKTPFSFDVSVWEFFWTLMTGARLVVARPGGHHDTAYLIDLIEARQINALHFVPSMLQVFLEEPELDRCRGLKRVICSGEALPFELQERFFARLNAELHNLYGPTEAAVDVTRWRCRPHDELGTVPIGHPIANTQIHLLDEHLQPVPVAVAGELYIGGANLGRGYLNRPDLTAERFIPNPFDSDAGSRLYRTGDLARRLPDGSVEFLGRVDNQVKIRGFRVELGEIEAALNKHPAVRESVVLAGADARGAKRLTAYVVPAQERAPTSGELRTFLTQRLPGYMAPSAFFILNEMPLTPNGKVDRRQLSLLNPPRPGDERTLLALERLDRLSEDEVRAMLAERKDSRRRGVSAAKPAYTQSEV